MTMELFRLDGKVALVTGAAQGLGQGMALALAEAGANLALLDRSDPLDTVQKVEALGRRALPLNVDLSTASTSDLSQTIEGVTAQLGRLDILVNNAGIIRRS